MRIFLKLFHISREVLLHLPYLSLVIFAIISYIFADPEDKGLVKETIFGSVFFGLFSGSILWFTLFIPPIIILLSGMITLAGSGFVFLLLFGSVTPVIGVGTSAYLLTQNTTIAVITALERLWCRASRYS